VIGVVPISASNAAFLRRNYGSNLGMAQPSPLSPDAAKQVGWNDRCCCGWARSTALLRQRTVN